MGGVRTNVGDFPSQVSVQKVKYTGWYNSYIFHLCGGTIINSLHVLTAAHCLFNGKKGIQDPFNIKILTGDNSLSNSHWSEHRVFYQAVLCIPFSEYQYDFHLNDIGIVRVHIEIDFTPSFVEAAPIGTGWLKDDDLCSIVGWGRTDEENSRIETFQRTAQVPVVNSIFCKMSYGPYMQYQVNFCAGYRFTGEQDACLGDSGGGLFFNKSVYGVVSLGYGCGQPYYPGLYTNVTLYKRWFDAVFAFNGTQKQVPVPRMAKQQRKRSTSIGVIHRPVHFLINLPLTMYMFLVWNKTNIKLLALQTGLRPFE